MKFRNLKKPLAILMTLALIIGVFSVSLVASAEGNGYWKEVAVNSSVNKTIATDWTAVAGSSVTTTYSSKTDSTTGVVTNNSATCNPTLSMTDEAIRLGMRFTKKDGVEQSDTTQSWTGPREIGKVTPNLPAGARIKEVSFDVETAAEQSHRNIQIFYDYTDAENYKAIGLHSVWVNNNSSAVRVYLSYNQTATTDATTNGTGTNITLFTLPAGSVSKGISYFKNSKLIYTYEDDGTVTATFYTEFYKSVTTTLADGTTYEAGELLGSATANLGTITSPKVILSGGAPRATNTTNTYGDYTNISYKYETWIDLDADITAFKTNYPISTLVNITAENAIESAKAANKAIQAYSELTDENLKQALADYIADCEAVVARAEVFLNGTYKLDFTNEETATQFATTKTFAVNGSKTISDTSTIGDMTYTYDNNIMKLVGPNFNNVDGTTANMYTLPTDSKIKQVTGKIAMTGGGTWSSLKVYFSDSQAAAYKSGVQISYTTSGTNLSAAYFRNFRSTANHDMNNIDVSNTSAAILNSYNGTEVTSIAAPDVTDVSTYLLFKIIISDSGRPTMLLYAPNSDVPFVGYSCQNHATSGYSFTDWTSVAFAVTRPSTIVYLADVEISYVERDTFTINSTAQTFTVGEKAALVAPTMDGASIAATAAVGEQDLRFQASYDPDATVIDGFTAVEYGMIVMTEAKMPSTGELTMAAVGAGGLGTVVGKMTLAEGETLPSTYYLELDGSGALEAFNTNIATIVGKRFVARAYVAYKDNTTGHIYYVYSDNKNDKGAENGQASKSVIGVAKSIAQNILTADSTLDTDGTIAGIIAQTTTTTALQREQLLTFIYNNQAKITL